MTRQNKANHSRLILAVQAHQRSSGSGDGVDVLAGLSKRSSSFSRNRAVSLATGYWELEKESENAWTRFEHKS